ncbi:MAG TPA: hypothetical protein VE956_19440 [Nodularia sp. (in: cyanobacteria)]|nr:hypothetical protein [Nodularia sp. (in: cyanobacteria)]
MTPVFSKPQTWGNECHSQDSSSGKQDAGEQGERGFGDFWADAGIITN